MVVVYINGITKMIAAFKMIPGAVSDCKGLQDSWNEVLAKMSRYTSSDNWGEVLSNLTNNFALNSMTLIGYFTQAMFALQKNDYYSFGEMIGEALELMICMDDIQEPEQPPAL